MTTDLGGVSEQIVLPPEPIPTLNEWGLLMLAAILSGLGVLRLRY